MRRLSYWLCFVLIAVPTAYGLLAWLLSFIGKSLPFPPVAALAFSFSSLVPQLAYHLVPTPILAVLGYGMLYLLARRIWLLAFKKEGVPTSYRGVPQALGYVGAASFLLAAVVFILSIALRAGSGVPAGLLLLPATICIPWAFALTEVLSFRKGGAREA
jgi:hypothetical protein